MLLPKLAKPWLCCAKEAGRYAVTDLHLTVTGDGRGLLRATDGRMVCEIPVVLSEGDTTGLVPAELAKGAKVVKRATYPNGTLQAPGVDVEGREVCANGHVTATTKAGPVTMPRPEGEFPECAGAILDAACAPAGKLALTLNARFLLAIQEAMGADHVTLLFDAPKPAGDRDTSWSEHSNGSRFYTGGAIGIPYGSEEAVPGRAALMPVTVG